MTRLEASKPDTHGSESPLSDQAKATMAKGSKSFSLAALLFDPERREAARYLYSWCRYCDDEVDSAPDHSTALDRLDRLERLTKEALSDRPTGVPAFEALRAIAKAYSIPSLYPLELLEGMRMDVEGRAYHTIEELELYCYRVASVVGLMMVHVMGVSSAQALRHAVDTGLAMQMTNIARDVREDFEMGRMYLPREWFKEAGVAPPEIGQEFSPSDCVPVIEKLLERADLYYASGQQGLKYLPVRAAFAVAAAQKIYQEIGVRVQKRASQAWTTRTVVPLRTKIRRLIQAIAAVASERLARGLNRAVSRTQTRDGDTATETRVIELRETFGPEDLLKRSSRAHLFAAR